MDRSSPSTARRLLSLAAFTCLTIAPLASPAHAFCGFYVAKADTDLFNQASKVVMVRDGDRTVITMANDYRGDASEFAMVIPVPTFLERDQIHVGDRAVIDHLDAYTAPRLVEYFDSDPCPRPERRDRILFSMVEPSAPPPVAKVKAKQLGVTVEAEYSIGEYDILILSAKESDGLETWLQQNGYRLPDGTSRVLSSYIKQTMRFFVAKVNLEAQERLGYTYLRPLQVAFETPKFMLPIRLGTVNANGPQELFVFALTRSGRVETTNYRTVRLPTGTEVPAFVQHEFGDFYRAMFARQVEQERMRTVFLEYAWDMGWCDPCAADPLSTDELRQLGVFWVDDTPVPARRAMQPAAQDVFVTRLHLRYTGETFPEDLVFQETGDRSNFQGRFVIRHPWQGDPNACPAARKYFDDLAERRDREAMALASLTGWPIQEIRAKVPSVPGPFGSVEPGGAVPAGDDTPWWKKIWGSDG